MSHHRYIAIIAGAGFIAWISFLLVLFKLNPYESTGLSLTFLILTLFIALSSSFTVIGFYFRLWLFRNEIFYKHINIALRQGVVLSFVVIFCLIIQMIRMLNWWSGLLLIVIAILMESYFSSKDSELS